MPAKKQSRKIIGACFVRLENLVDLARLSCALERAPYPIFVSKLGDKLRLAVQIDLFAGVPIFYYVEADKAGEFLAYRSSGEGEEVQFVDSTQNPSFIYTPLIHIVKMPAVLEDKKKFDDKFLAAEVANISNLVKIASYKMLYEEPPLPLFAFKNGEKWVVGSFARLDDYEEASLFFFAKNEAAPPSGFVRYSPSRMADIDFSKRTDEHGFVYVKVIKLAERHPLVAF